MGLEWIISRCYGLMLGLEWFISRCVLWTDAGAGMDY